MKIRTPTALLQARVCTFEVSRRGGLSRNFASLSWGDGAEGGGGRKAREHDVAVAPEYY